MIQCQLIELVNVGKNATENTIQVINDFAVPDNAGQYEYILMFVLL